LRAFQEESIAAEVVAQASTHIGEIHASFQDKQIKRAFRLSTGRADSPHKKEEFVNITFNFN
jgi:hypothetical protein